LTANEIVARSNPGEQTVDNADASSGGWNKAPDLRHQHDQAHLSKHRRFTRHVRAGENDHSCIFRQRDVVGNELLARHHSLYHRMSSGHYLESEIIGELRPNVAFPRRHLSK
jgi:hypothetical protein